MPLARKTGPRQPQRPKMGTFYFPRTKKRCQTLVLFVRVVKGSGDRRACETDGTSENRLVSLVYLVCLVCLVELG